MTDVKLAKILYQPLSTIKSQKASHNSKRLQYEIFSSFEENELNEIVNNIIKKNDYLLMTKDEMINKVTEKLKEDARYKNYNIESNKKLEAEGLPLQLHADIFAFDKTDKKALIIEYMHTQQSKKTLLSKYSNYDLVMSEHRIRFQLIVLNFDSISLTEEPSLFSSGEIENMYEYMNIGEILNVSNDKIIVV